jgi:hypothetical protein
MRTYDVDRTGFTGEDLMSRDQPLFTQATVDYTDDEAAVLPQIGRVLANYRRSAFKREKQSSTAVTGARRSVIPGTESAYQKRCAVDLRARARD